MKGDQMGILAAYPTQRELPLSNQTRFKWDGYRLIAFLHEGAVRLATRGGHDWTARFPLIATALKKLPARSAILDGEAVVLDQRGVPSFGALQAALGSRKGPGDKTAHEAVLYA